MSELIDGNTKFSDAYIRLLIDLFHEFCFVEICKLMNHFISYITRKLIICLFMYSDFLEKDLYMYYV